MKIYIDDSQSGHKHIAQDVRVYVVDDDGTEVDISRMVTRAAVDLRMGKPAKATLEVFITGFKSRSEAEEIVIKYVRPRRFWNRLRRPRNVTTFNETGAQEYVR